jgi:hypothetical protein
MAKILFDLQISSYSSDNSVPLIESDSNWLFTSAIIEELKKHGHDCAILIGWNWPFFKTPCRFYFTEYRETELDRYFMNFDDITSVLNDFEPDILWTNDPCRVGAYRAVFPGKIIAYNHWIDNPADPKMPPQKTYYYRQIEAFQKADYCLFNSAFGKKMFEDGLVNIRTPWAQTGIVNPPLKTDVLQRYTNITFKSSHPTLLFNHRLSSAPQYSKNVDNLITIMDHLDKFLGSTAYDVFVSNPSGKQHPILERSNVVNIYHSDYETYIQDASRAWVQLTMFEYPGQWSMALGEALCLGLVCFCPAHSGYGEMNHMQTIYRHTNIPRTIDALIPLLQLPSAPHNPGQSKHYLNIYSAKHIVKTQVLPIIQELI